MGAEWYANVEEHRLREWLRPFAVALVEVDGTACDVRALAVR